MQMKLLALLSFLFVWTITEAQQDSHTYDLKKCLAYAQENNPHKNQLEISRKEVNAEAKLAKSKFLPQLGAYTDYRQFIDNTTYIFPADEGRIISGGTSDSPYPIRLGQKFNMYAGVNFSQVLFDKRWLSANEFGNLSTELLTLSEEVLDEEVIYNISITYYEIQKLKSKIELINDAINRTNKLREILELQVDNGVVKRSELDRLNLTLSKLGIDRQQLLANTDLMISRLKYTMGMPEETGLIITDEDLLVSELVMGRELSTKNRILAQQQKLGELKIKDVADDYFPTVRAYGDFQFQAQRNSFNFLSDEKWFPQHYFGVGIKFPILTGFEKKAKMELEQIELERIKIKQERITKEEAIQLQQATNQLAAANLFLDHNMRNNSLSEVLYKQIELEYEQGITALRDLLIASADQTVAANQYEEAYFEYKLAQINYLKASSRLKDLLQ